MDKILSCSACVKSLNCMKNNKEQYEKYSSQDPYENFGCIDFDPYYDYNEDDDE